MAQSVENANDSTAPVSSDFLTEAELRRGTTFDLGKTLAPLVAEQLIAQQSPDAPKYI